MDIARVGSQQWWQWSTVIATVDSDDGSDVNGWWLRWQWTAMVIATDWNVDGNGWRWARNVDGNGNGKETETGSNSNTKQRCWLQQQHQATTPTTMTPSITHLPGDGLMEKASWRCGVDVGNKCCRAASGDMQQHSCISGSGIAAACRAARDPRFMKMKNKTINQVETAPKPAQSWQNGNSVVVQWQRHCSGPCHAASNSVQILKNVERQQSTSSNRQYQRAIASKSKLYWHNDDSHHRHGTTWHNGGMHCGDACGTILWKITINQGQQYQPARW